LQGIDLGDGQVQRGHHVGIRRALKANMRIANLYEAEIPLLGLPSRELGRGGLSERP
jgi:hypothetical protein